MAERGRQNLYAVLGVRRNVAVDALRKAYRHLARTHHPDVNPGDAQAEERFKQISEAYSVLSDPERRRNYDGFHRETAGCQFADVAVDTDTGVVRVERVVAVHDAGRIIDRLTSRSQVIGGVIQGISYALHEDRRMDRNLGDMVNPTFDTYKILGVSDCPQIDVVAP